MKTTEKPAEDLVPVVALETLTISGENKGPGTVVHLPRPDAEDLVARGAVAWPGIEDHLAPASARPEGVDLIAAIGQAMRSIDPTEGVTPEGKASLYALRHHLGFEVTAEERDEAHEIFAGRRDLFSAPDKHDFGSAILNAIRDLDPKIAAQWTQDGRPDARALSEILKQAVSAADRDAAWAEFQNKAAELAEKK
jgi:hypothetical protein